MQKDIKTPETEELMTRQQVMDYLNIKQTTLWMWEKKGILSPCKIGRKYFYSKSDILALQRGEALA